MGAAVHLQPNMTGMPPCAIVTMGVSGCGKTTLTGHLAQHLSCAAFDGDDFHSPANVAKMSAGQPLNDDDRWPWLDRLGEAIGKGVHDGGIAVAACSALKRSYRERLERAAGVPLLFVLLDGEREEIATHLASRPGHYMPLSLLESQLATLERPGAGERALALHCYAPLDELRDNVLAWVQAGIAIAR
jgi:gluconokinase